MPSADSLRLTVKWVLLPNGVSADGSELLFSAYAALALSGDEVGGGPTLADFPDLLDWPSTIGRIDFGVEFDGSGRRHPARLLPGDRSTAVWQTVFGPTTTVIRYLPENMTARPVMTFSAIPVLSSLRHSYARLVVDSITDLQLIAPFAPSLAAQDRPFADVATALRQPVLRSLMGGGEPRANMLRTLVGGARTRADSPTGMIEVLPQGESASDEVVRAVAFHAAQEPPPAVDPTPEQLAADRQALHDSVDFHKIISSLNEHPALLRRLGIVVDLAVPRTATNRTSGTVRLLPVWDSTFPSIESTKGDRSLWIAWRLDPAAALPFSAAAHRLPGVLDIGTQTAFSVHPMALDSAVLQTVAMVSALPPGGERSAPPALRSGGLTLIQEGRGQATHEDLTAAVQDGRGASPDTALRAHDVTRGYRLDVFDADTEVWRSLHARRVTYAKDDVPLIEPVLDEGSHHPSATGPSVPAGGEPAANAPIFLHESFVRWDGWSLSAPRPGRSLGVDPSGPDPARPETMPQHTTNDPLTQAGLRIETGVQRRSLPRLRFGRRYRVRVRTVDLAGNGLDLAAADALWQRPMVTLSSGQAAAPDVLASAEIRFSRFEPVPPPVIIQRNPERQSAHRLVLRTITDDPALEVTSAECRLYAPKGTVELAEWHGMFDTAIGSGDAALVRASFDVAARESGVLPDAGADELPYLPDPLAIGVAIAGGPELATGLTQAIKWIGPSWDRPRPITLRLLVNDELSPDPLDTDQDEALITAKLDPARSAKLRISSAIPRGTPFGLMDWLGEDTVDAELDEDKRRQLRRAIDNGRHVMFTPWEDLELVHAVQRPQEAPNLMPADTPVVRKPGETTLKPNCTLIREPFSTSTLTLQASWTDLVDDPAVRFEPPADGAPMPWLRPVTTVVGSTPLEVPERTSGVEPLIPRTDLYFGGSSMPALQFSDTRHRDVTCTVTALSRFVDEFPELADRPDAFTITGTSAVAIAPSTARPPAPAVADVVPLVSTGPVSVPDGRVDREDGWLRIWLERPWFTSGAGELLGVVLLDRTPTGPADPMYDYVSLAGRDAAHGTVFINGVRPDNAVNPVAVERGVILPECLARLGGLADRVSVALFAPEFDFVSQRWYADVRIDLFGYFPMVRLAVVRYQPTSVANDDPALSAHHYFVSPVVLLDPIPLFPGRRLTVKKVIKPTRSLLQLELSGTTYTEVMALTGEPTRKAPALSRVTARPQSRFPVELAGGGEHWLNGPEIRFKRDDPSKPWRLQLEGDQLRELGPDVERILVVEEDHVPADPAVPDFGEFAPRTVFAAVVEGPFF